MSDRVIVLHEKDNVATALTDLAIGDVIEVRGSVLRVNEAVPFGHKIALAETGDVHVKLLKSIPHRRAEKFAFGGMDQSMRCKNVRQSGQSTPGGK